MTNKRKAVWYIVYIVLAVLTILIYSFFTNPTTGGVPSNPFLAYASRVVSGVAFGMIIGAVHLFNESRKNGKWTFDPLKAIIFGIPTFLIIIALPVYYLTDIRLPDILINTQLNMIVMLILTFYIFSCFTKTVALPVIFHLCLNGIFEKKTLQRLRRLQILKNIKVRMMNIRFCSNKLVTHNGHLVQQQYAWR